MPKVGKTHFPYTKAGYKAAAKAKKKKTYSKDTIAKARAAYEK